MIKVKVFSRRLLQSAICVMVHKEHVLRLGHHRRLLCNLHRLLLLVGFEGLLEIGSLLRFLNRRLVGGNYELCVVLSCLLVCLDRRKDLGPLFQVIQLSHLMQFYF